MLSTAVLPICRLLVGLLAVGKHKAWGGVNNPATRHERSPSFLPRPHVELSYPFVFYICLTYQRRIYC